MRSLIVCALTALLLSGGAQAAVAPTPAVTARGLDKLLLIQQRYTADVAASFYVTFESLIRNALTNQLMAAQALAIYTNGLDAADAQAVAESVARMSQSANDLLQDFLVLQADMNYAFRDQLAADMTALVAAAAQSDVQAFANGLVGSDVTATGAVEVANYDARAIYIPTNLVSQVEIYPRHEQILTGVPTRYAARVYIHDPAGIGIDLTSYGPHVWLTTPYDTTKPHHLLEIQQFSSTVYIVKVMNFE